MKFLSLRTKIIIVFTLVIVGGSVYLIGRSNSSAQVPQEFGAARLQGAVVSQDIVNLSNQLTEDLSKVNQYDQNKDFPEALTLTTSLLERSQDIRNKAAALSNQLAVMARALPQISSAQAREAAFDSINNRVALIDRLINYSGYLSQLLDALREKFGGANAPDERVSALIDKINAEVTAINDLNRKATDSIERFDQIIKSGR